jgi:methylmalonic aciduria homocystinuria type C protein
MYSYAKQHFLRDPEAGHSSSFDPVDQLTRAVHSKLVLPNAEAFDLIYDHDLNIVRRIPRVLVQTAGHVAGVARFYQPKEFAEVLWPEEETDACAKKKRYGVAIHARYGGWFAFRGVVVLKNILAPSLQRTEAPPILPLERVRYLLDEYNTDWSANRWRDVMQCKGENNKNDNDNNNNDDSSTIARYEEEQVGYFAAANQQARRRILMGNAT